MKLYSAYINTLLVHLQHNKLICSRLRALKKMIGKDECLDQFWRDYSVDLKKLSLKRKYNHYLALTTVEDNAVKALCTGASYSGSSSDASNISGENTEATTTNVTDVNDDKNEKVEHDGVYVQGMDTSAGTLFKLKALELHEKYKDAIKQCTVDDRKIITNGLSSILDLSNESINSQHRFFSVDQWEELHAHFTSLKMTPSPIDSLINSTLPLISHFFDKDANVDRSLKYVKSLLGNDLTLEQQFCLTILEHFLKLIKDYHPMLARNPLLDYTEADYTCIIWFKLFKKMFPSGNNIVRIKSGESIFDVSTSKKKDLYPKSKYVKGFKIDIRFVVDVGEKEIDLAAAEKAKDDSVVYGRYMYSNIITGKPDIT